MIIISIKALTCLPNITLMMVSSNRQQQDLQFRKWFIYSKFYIGMQGKRYQMFNMRSQEVKFNAFFQYLKSFSEAGLDTLQKLENEFNKEMRKKLKHCETLSTIKNLLSSYEIFILEIKDSCDFVEISEFGYCIGKTFLQLLKIIKWFLKAWLKDTRKYEKVKASMESQSNEEMNIMNQQNLCAFCQELIRSTPYGRQMKGKRKGVNINDIGSEMRDAKLNHKKQMTHLLQAKENILERYTQKQIESRKHIGELADIDILNRKHIAMKLEISNNESVLEEVLNEFSIKTEAMSRFVSNTQANCIEDFRMNQETDYIQFEEQMRASITQKYNEAREKLKNLVLQKIADHDRHRKDKLVEREVQTFQTEYSQKEKSEAKIKQLGAAVQKLKNELDSEKALSQSLRQLLESKSVEFQRQFLNYRKEVITNDVKSRHYLKSLKSFKDAVEEEDEQDDSNSIQLEDTPEPNSPFRKHIGRITSGNLKDRPKNRYSIKFTLEEPSNRQNDCINQSLQELDLTLNEAGVQTQPVCILQETSVNSAPSYFIFKEKAAKSLAKQFRSNKAASEKPPPKKSHTQLYAHVKSKVVNMLQRDGEKSVRRDFKQSRSSCMGELVKKLSVDYLFPHKKELSGTPVKLFPLAAEVTFTHVASLYLGKEDILNLFLSDKNAHNYECLIYRSSLFSLANLNQKRAVSLAKQVESDAEWVGRRDGEGAEGKVVHAFYHQLNSLRKKERSVYEQVKQLMRSPYELSKKVEVIQLQHGEAPSKDIEVGELKRMLNIILKFHCDCIGTQQDAICEHIANFALKIGIKLI